MRDTLRRFKSGVFQALGHPTRIAIVELLRDEREVPREQHADRGRSVRLRDRGELGDGADPRRAEIDITHAQPRGMT